MGGGKLRIFLLHLVGHIFASLDFAFEIQSDGLCLSNATVSLCNVLIDMVVFWSTVFLFLLSFVPLFLVLGERQPL